MKIIPAPDIISLFRNLELSSEFYLRRILLRRRGSMDWTPGMVPYGADQTVDLVIDSLGALGSFHRETEIERAAPEAVILTL
jgi:hypothetical protein